MKNKRIADRIPLLDICEKTKARFFRLVEEDPDGCWIWKGRIKERGYGRFWFRGSRVAAHRVSWAIHHDQDPEHLEIDHLCRVRRCVNPSHLEAVTGSENLRRRDEIPFSRFLGKWKGPTTRVRVDRVLSFTESAVCVQVTDRTVWLPFSHLQVIYPTIAFVSPWLHRKLEL